MSESSAPCLWNNGKPGRCYKNVIPGTGYCQQHQPEPYVRSPWRKPKDWDRIREGVIARDKGICYLCSLPGADGAEHIVPQSEGGSNKPFNLKAVHDKVAPFCHRAKTAKEAQQALRDSRTAKRRTR